MHLGGGESRDISFLASWLGGFKHVCHVQRDLLGGNDSRVDPKRAMCFFDSRPLGPKSPRRNCFGKAAKNPQRLWHQNVKRPWHFSALESLGIQSWPEIPGCREWCGHHWYPFHPISWGSSWRFWSGRRLTDPCPAKIPPTYPCSTISLLASLKRIPFHIYLEKHLPQDLWSFGDVQQENDGIC